jgi:rRNA maturation RNase YbeY
LTYGCFVKRAVDLRLLRQITRVLLKDVLAVKSFELAVRLVDAAEMTRLNESFLHHAGSTDVITFDYALGPNKVELQGDIIICVSEAADQARRFRATWPEEVVRYLVHGVLHLRGYDDLNPAARRAMKREENRLLRDLNRRFVLRRLGGRTDR